MLRRCLSLLLALAAGLQMPVAVPGHAQPVLRRVPLLSMKQKRGNSTPKGFGAPKQVIRSDSAPLPYEPRADSSSESATLTGDANDGDEALLRQAAEDRGRAYLDQMRAADSNPGAVPRRVNKQQLTAEELEPLDPTAGVMPEVVSNRMLGRVIPFAALPVFGAVALFGGFYYANTQLGYILAILAATPHVYINPPLPTPWNPVLASLLRVTRTVLNPPL